MIDMCQLSESLTDLETTCAANGCMVDVVQAATGYVEECDVPDDIASVVLDNINLYETICSKNSDGAFCLRVIQGLGGPIEVLVIL
jgi:hypothetical protein